MVFEVVHGYSLYEKVKEKNNTLGDCKSDRVISVNFMQSDHPQVALDVLKAVRDVHAQQAVLTLLANGHLATQKNPTQVRANSPEFRAPTSGQPSPARSFH